MRWSAPDRIGLTEGFVVASGPANGNEKARSLSPNMLICELNLYSGSYQ